MSPRRQLKRIIKRIARPFVRPVIHALHLQLFGKHVFINKYTKRIPGLDRLIWLLEVKMLINRTSHERMEEYEKWFKQNYPNKNLLKRQRSQQTSFKERPLISVLVPTYNTNPKFLRECIESVQAQTYDNWQLCLADDASTNPMIAKTLEEYARADDRINYVIREENGHICRASNSALELAKGEFVALLDHDDVLWPNALFEVVKVINEEPRTDFIYSDEDKIDERGKKHSEPFFKPDWSPEYLRSVNYITHFAVLRHKLVNKIGGFRPGYEGAQDWDLFLRASRETDRIHHVPTVLYSWRKSSTSTAQQPSAKDYAYVSQKKALQDDARQRGYKAKIEWQIPFSMWRVEYELKSKPLVSIVIPTKNQYEFIERCLRSIKEKTTYGNFEIVITDTGSTDSQVWELYEQYAQVWPGKLKVVKWEKPFNFAAACDFGAEHANGKYLLFLNNDTEVISPEWIGDMLAYAQQDEIGAVGCKLLYPNRLLQHGGIVLGVGGLNGTPGIAGHYFPAFIDNPPQDPMQQLYVGGTRNFMAVTAACVMVSAQKFKAVKGFDDAFQIAFNDVDFCLKLFDKGWRNVYLPHVYLYHHESISVGQLGSKQRDPEVFQKEIQLMLKRWGSLIENDPYYHPEFRKDIASARLNVNP